MKTKLALRLFALAYLALLLVAPVGMVFWQALRDGLEPLARALASPDALHALRLTLFVVVASVLANSAFGVLCALLLVRGRFPGRSLLTVMVDLPFTLSPVVVGLALVAVYGQGGWLGGWLAGQGVQVIFATPGILLATLFATLPFVVREVAPLLREVGTDEEAAAYTLGASPLQAFWRITLPAIRWGLIYGIVLTTARALGEFGAVSVVSGKIAGRTETLTLLVESRFQALDLPGAYAVSLLLAILALATLLVMKLLGSREHE